MPRRKSTVEREFECLGTNVYLQIVVPSGSPSLKRRAEEDLRQMETFYFCQQKRFSRFDRQSELSYLNRNIGRWVAVSGRMKDVCERSLKYFNSTEGYFDPRILSPLIAVGYSDDFKKNNFAVRGVPQFAQEINGDLADDLSLRSNFVRFSDQMDFSGIVKGAITAWAAEIFREKGWKDFIIDSGGDMFASGRNKDGEAWRIAVEGVSEGRLMLELSNEGVATSGISKRKWEVNQKRFHHLINPKCPSNFSFSLRSVTVIADSPVEADVWAKVLFLIGKERGLKLSKERGLRSFFLEYNGCVATSAAARSHSIP